jgi:hypothetical protein
MTNALKHIKLAASPENLKVGNDEQVSFNKLHHFNEI